jgi:two-component system KDP operon response regulator KdpE
MARLVAVNLAARGYRVKQFDNGPVAIAGLGTDDPDLIILDILMPEVDGLEVTKQIRQVSRVPILILSVRDETAAKLAALDLGADDYLTKPFRVEELLARMRAILRRTAPAGLDSPRRSYAYRSGDLLIDLEGLRVLSHDQPIHLTPREWALLQVLVENAGKVVSSRQLLQDAWGPDYGDEADYVRTYVTRLRRKLEPDPQHPCYILLERGFGYRLVEAD